MQPSLSQLAKALDDWSGADRATLTETEEVIAVNGLRASDAVELAALCQDLSWSVLVEDGTGGETRTDSLLPDFEPFRFVLTKPLGVAGPGRLVTNTALATTLERDGVAGVIRLVRCKTPFETLTAYFSPFDDEAPFQSEPVAAKPRHVVRETGARRLVSEDIGAWLLKDRELIPWTDECFRVWLRFAVPNAIRALANEVEAAFIVFRGPPLVRLQFTAAATGVLDEAEFRALQNATAWVYDNERELEMRHGLYSAEMARTASGEADAVQAMRRFAAPALESARIAYSLNLSQVNRDTLKALADLRKAVSDETSKLADSTRTVAGAVATALFAGVGLLITRSTTNAPGILLVGLTIILALYVGAVIWSGESFIKVQAGIRANWRQRLYVFLPTKDYDEMVEVPAREAEDAFHMAALLGGIISILLIAGVSAFVVMEPTKSSSPIPPLPLKPVAPAVPSDTATPPATLPEAPPPAVPLPGIVAAPTPENPSSTAKPH